MINNHEETVVIGPNGKGISSNPTFDRLELIASVDGDLDVLKELVELFLEQSPKSLKSIRDAILQDNSHALDRASHFLKGSLGNFFAPEAVHAALVLEKLGSDGSLGQAAESFATLENAVQQLQTELIAFVDEPSTTTN
jgi:two-component system sensor histidine kinase/response regulator